MVDNPMDENKTNGSGNEWTDLVALYPGLPLDGAEVNRRWKVKVNNKIEVDEV